MSPRTPGRRPDGSRPEPGRARRSRDGGGKICDPKGHSEVTVFPNVLESFPHFYGSDTSPL